MLTAERRQRIIEALEQSKTVSIVELSKLCAVSRMTIRRDLEVLEQEQYLKRTRGGAMRIEVTAKEPRFETKQIQNAALKNTLARYAAEHLVADNDCIILEGGTTVTAMVKYLKSHRNLTVVTNGLRTLHELQLLLDQASVVCSGGILRPISQTLVGPIAERFFQSFHAKTVFFSATGLDLNLGLTDPNMLETQIKRCMIASAAQTVVIIDSSKLGIKAFDPWLALAGIDTLVIDDGVTTDFLAELRQRCKQVILVPRHE